MQHVIIVIHLMLVLALIGVVLLQRSEGGGLGIGSSGGFMTSRGTANVLTRACNPGGAVLCDQPRPVDPGWDQSQTDIDFAGRPKRPDGAGRADAAWRRGRIAQPVAGRATAGRPGGSPFRATGAAVEMKSRAKGRKFRPFSVVGVGR